MANITDDKQKNLLIATFKNHWKKCQIYINKHFKTFFTLYSGAILYENNVYRGKKQDFLEIYKYIDVICQVLIAFYADNPEEIMQLNNEFANDDIINLPEFQFID